MSRRDRDKNRKHFEQIKREHAEAKRVAAMALQRLAAKPTPKSELGPVVQQGRVAKHKPKPEIPVPHRQPGAEPDPEPLLLTLAEALRMLGLKRATFYRNNQPGKVTLASGAVRYRRSDLEKYVAELKRD